MIGRTRALMKQSWAGHHGQHFPSQSHSHHLRSSSDLDSLHSSGSLSLDKPPPVPLQLPPEHLFTCTVGRNRSQARWVVPWTHSIMNTGFHHEYWLFDATEACVKMVCRR